MTNRTVAPTVAPATLNRAPGKCRKQEPARQRERRGRTRQRKGDGSRIDRHEDQNGREVIGIAKGNQPLAVFRQRLEAQVFAQEIPPQDGTDGDQSQRQKSAKARVGAGGGCFRHGSSAFMSGPA